MVGIPSGNYSLLHLTVLRKHYTLDSFNSNVKQTPEENGDQLYIVCHIARNDIVADSVKDFSYI